METPQFKDESTQVFNEISERQLTVEEIRCADTRSLVALYGSELLLFVGFVLIFLNNMSILAPGKYFGAFSWVTVLVFSIGLFINFISIPYLYFSSFRNFKNDNDFWDKQTFWILPLFFFGTFYLYNSQISFSLILLLISLMIIAAVHFRFIKRSYSFLMNSSEEAIEVHQQYFQSLKYLTAYYVLLFAVLLMYNPLQKVFVWIRLNL